MKTDRGVRRADPEAEGEVGQHGGEGVLPVDEAEVGGGEAASVDVTRVRVEANDLASWPGDTRRRLSSIRAVEFPS
jgi:hypothetical protein